MSVRLFAPRPVDDPPETPPAKPEDRGLRRGREAAAFVLFVASVYLCLALATLRVDPRAGASAAANLVGPVGAAGAGALARVVGVVAWLLPVELALLGMPFLLRRPNRVTLSRVAGDLAAGLMLASLVHVALPDVNAFGGVPAGGRVGLLFGTLMEGWFSTVGSFLVGGTVVGLILIDRSAFSFIDACRRVVSFCRLAALRAGDGGRRAAAAWRRARRLRAERRQAERVAARPKIDARPSDEAIIAQLDDRDSDPFPIETTGAPPLAISAALRESTGGAASAGIAHELVGDSVPSCGPAVEPQAPRGPHEEDDRDPQPARPARRRARKAAAEPTIVDTRPEQETRRATSRREDDDVHVPPPTDLLDCRPPTITEIDRDRLYDHSKRLEKTLADYGVSGTVREIHPGPTVTTYEVEPEAGTKVSKVANLSDDLALGLSRTVRIIAPIPNKRRIGFELPNDVRVPVNLRELVEDERFVQLSERAPLPVVLGRDIIGAPFYADLASMPHVIVAGATGAGKSVGLNVMLASLLFRRSPDALRLLMVDPKVVELQPYDGIPHMLLPVVTDMKQAATALKWAVDEMERRYQLFANAGTKNIVTYNNWVKRVAAGELPPPDQTDVEAMSVNGEVVAVPSADAGSDGVVLPRRLPFIVIVVDEFADLMMQQGKEVEAAVARLAQKARAAGMHVILATQRPSVDVITGMIKANFPTRIGYRVAQKVDSRTILDEQGAELLLGKGDMLVKMNGTNETRRVQCPFISEEEVGALTAHLRAQGTPAYHDSILRGGEEASDDGVEPERVDSRFDEAVQIVAQTQRCSTSWLQRKMGIGYNRAAKMVDLMERRGFVGPQDGARDRDVLIPPP